MPGGVILLHRERPQARHSYDTIICCDSLSPGLQDSDGFAEVE